MPLDMIRELHVLIAYTMSAYQLLIVVQGTFFVSKGREVSAQK